ncbi:MAG: FHA domain-containing protein [Planctomycetota bacterium]
MSRQLDTDPRPYLEGIAPARARRRFYIGEGESTVGRARDTTVHLDDGDHLLSRVHARIVRTGAELTIRGDGANGTAVNAVAIGSEPHRLQVGDEICLAGKFRLRLCWPSHPQAVADTAPGAAPPPPRRRRRRAMRLLLLGWVLVWVVFLMLSGRRAAGTIVGAASSEDLLTSLSAPGNEATDPATAPGVRAALLTELRTHPRCEEIVTWIRSAVLLERQHRPAQAKTVWLLVVRACSRAHQPALYEHARAEVERLRR